MNKEELEVLFSANEYLVKLVPGLEKVREEIRQSDIKNIYEFVDGMQGVAWLMEAFTSIDECAKFNIDVSVVSDCMEEINSAIENEDFALLADIVEYEIEPKLREWLVELETILRGGDYAS